jgi:hypothetical protein
MVSAHLDDGQSPTALNEVCVGHASHQSARYRLSLSDVEERESSSGPSAATGTELTEGSLSGGNVSSSAVSCPRAVSSSATGSTSTGCRSVGGETIDVGVADRILRLVM